MKNSDNKWPFWGEYLNICCNCKETFAGPKRAPGCWKCLTPEGRDYYIKENQQFKNRKLDK